MIRNRAYQVTYGNLFVTIIYFNFCCLQSPLLARESKNILRPSSSPLSFLSTGNQKTSKAVLAAVFPHPLRFKQAWHLARGDKFLYAWKAVPPEGFLALGNICSTTGLPSLPVLYFFSIIPHLLTIIIGESASFLSLTQCI